MRFVTKTLPRIAQVAVLTIFLGACLLAHSQSSKVSVDQAVRNEATVRAFYEECLNAKRFELLPKLFATNVINHFNDKDEVGIEALTRATERVSGMFPDGHFILENVVASDNKVAATWRMTATNTTAIAGIAPTGKQVTERAVVFYRFEDGKIAEVWLQVDQVGFFRQLGAKELPIIQPITDPVDQSR